MSRGWGEEEPGSVVALDTFRGSIDIENFCFSLLLGESEEACRRCQSACDDVLSVLEGHRVHPELAQPTQGNNSELIFVLIIGTSSHQPAAL